MLVLLGSTFPISGLFFLFTCCYLALYCVFRLKVASLFLKKKKHKTTNTIFWYIMSLVYAF